MAITFDKLKEDARIFEELKKNPSWWVKFKNNPSLYIDIRKDNQVNVYFEGGSIARIHYCSKHNKLQVFTHHKYLGEPAPSRNNLYVECSDRIENICDEVMERIQTLYSQKKAEEGINAKEKWSEKFIQGMLVINSRTVHLDTEFAYNDAQDDIRIDLTQCRNGCLTFIELKRMDDNRMLHATDNNPEVVYQMQGYKDFIARYRSELLEYYKKVFDIKVQLGLPVPDSAPASINPIPELIIFDRWVKPTNQREIHRQRVRELLERNGILYKVITSL